MKSLTTHSPSLARGHYLTPPFGKGGSTCFPHFIAKGWLYLSPPFTKGGLGGGFLTDFLKIPLNPPFSKGDFGRVQMGRSCWILGPNYILHTQLHTPN